jgi:hypothetical protein
LAMLVQTLLLVSLRVAESQYQALLSAAVLG